MKKIKVLSLFDGISCARAALKKLNIEVDKYFASEIDKYAIQISKNNFPEIIQIGDIKTINTRMLLVRDIDLMIGGSPCQDLSIAKKDRQGLSGERSGLFYEYLRILKEVKPKYFILENVNSMPKEAKEEISKCLGVEPIMINAALVSAQTRKRLFWVGKLIDGKYQQVKIELPEDKGIFLKDVLEDGVNEIYQVPRGFNKGGIKIGKAPTMGANCYHENNKPIRVGHLNKDGQGDRIYSKDGKSVCLSANGGGRGAKTGLYAIPVALRNRGEGKKPEYNKTDKANALTTVQTDSMVAIPNKSKTIRTSGRGSGFGDRHNWDMINDIRKLTPIECERLQCLPDNYTQGVSNSQRYKALGNAFNVDVVAYILNILFNKNIKK